MHQNPADLYKFRFQKTPSVPLRSGDRPFKCPLCSSSFKMRHHLKNHFSVHSSKCRFKCDLCTKSFSRKTTLKSHRRIHFEDCMYHCDKCMTTFPDSDTLFYHKCPGKDELEQLANDLLQEQAGSVS